MVKKLWRELEILGYICMFDLSICAIYKTSFLLWKIHETNVFCNLEQVTSVSAAYTSVPWLWRTLQQ